MESKKEQNRKGSGAGVLILWNRNKQLRVNESGAWVPGGVWKPLCDGVLCFYRSNLINVALGSVLCIFRLLYFSTCVLHKSKHFYAPFKKGISHLNCQVKALEGIH